MDYIAVMVPESSTAVARGIVKGVEAQLAEARLAMREDDPIGGPLVPAR